MKVVLDTNVLASGIFWGGTPAKILNLLESQKFEFLGSEEILDEYLRILRGIALKIGRPDIYQSWALILPSKIHLISIKKSFRLCRDPKDDMFIDCAIAGKAKVIVSGDHDLLVLKKIMNVRIVNPRDFLLIQKNEP